jgi:hypothetical protein
MPGRDTAPGFLLRGRERGRARGFFVRDQKKETKPCRFRRVKVEIRPAARGAQSGNDPHAKFVGG